MNIDPHYYGQGRISLALLDAITGVAGAFKWIGDVSAFSLKPNSDKVQHKESWSGQRGLTDSFPIGAAIDINMTLYQFSPESLGRVIRSAIVTSVSGTASAESLGDTLAVGDEAYLANPGVSSLVITDSTGGAPLTLTEGTDYEVDVNFGRVKILDLGSYVQPFLASYSYSAHSAIGMLTQGQQKYRLKFEGVNLAESNAPVIVDIYKLAPDLVQELALITSGNDVAGMAITGAALLDTSRSATGALGQFGSITQLTAAV